jgi:tetratricopeptide (TPR) repeat protein
MFPRSLALLGAAWLVSLTGDPANAAPLTPAAQRSPTEIEREALRLLQAGRQSKAEELLEQTLATRDDLRVPFAVISLGRREMLARLPAIAPSCRQYQRVLFLHAACQRSRFDIPASLPYFYLVLLIDSETPAGACAKHVIFLDAAMTKDVDGKIANLGKLADAHPDDPLIRWMAAVQCRAHDRNAIGVAHYQKLAERWKPGPVLLHQTYANLLDELHRYDEALQERYQAVKLEPAAWNYDGLGNTLRYLGRYREAHDAHAKAVTLSPTSSQHWVNWGVTLSAEKRFSEAVLRCDVAVLLERWNWRAYYARGGAYDGMRDFDRAIADYSEALRLNPDHAYILCDRARAFAAKFDYDRAIDDCTEAIRRDPQHVDAYRIRAQQYATQGDLDRAMADCDAALRLRPEESESHYDRGTLWAAKREVDRAIADFTTALRLDPKNLRAYHNRANAYGRKRDFDRAIADYSAAIRLDPKNAKGYRDRAAAYQAKGETAKAEADFALAKKLRLPPDKRTAQALP